MYSVFSKGDHEDLLVNLNPCLPRLGNVDLTLTFPHNFRLQNNSLRSRLAVQKQCMGACMVG